LRKNREVPYYSCLALENISWLRHGFSTRTDGSGGTLNLNPAGMDTPERINDNYSRLLSAIGLENAAFVSLNQIHSNLVYVVESTAYLPRMFNLFQPEEIVRTRQAETGDALVTNIENTALTIKTADCFPILIADPVHRAVGAVHSGWRGTLAGVLPRAIDEMSRRFQSDPARLLFAIGPAIRECCFEVGEEVARLFSKTYPEAATARPHPTAPGKYLVNLAAVLKIQMTQSGARPENQHDLEMCTCCNTREFFSWRAQGAAAGRMLSVIAVSYC